MMESIGDGEAKRRGWYMCNQGLIEPPKAARGHVTAHSANVDGEIQHVTKNTLPAVHVLASIR